MPNQVVYHGSPTCCFEEVNPRRNRRVRSEDGKDVVIFDDLSFHATPYKWIALAYTYHPGKQWSCNGKTGFYNMGVDLYNGDKEVFVHGVGSLEKSLEELYAKGGYLYVFDGAHFFHTNGLGNLEVITQNVIRPIRIECIEDPVQALRNEGVRFVFIDESK